MDKYLVEFLGTFFLVFTVCVAAVFGNAGDFAPIAIGMVLAIMIYGGGHISGGHFNPAVSLGVTLRGKSSWTDLGPYIGAQLLAAVVAVFIAKAAVPGVAVEAADLSGKFIPILISEFLFTFALVWTVLNTATAKATAGNSNYGLCIGGIVMVGAFTVGGISLGAFNPAVTLGLVVVGKLPATQIVVYVLAQLIAGAAAAFAFRGLVKDQG